MVGRRRVARALVWSPIAVWVLATAGGLVGVVSLLARQQWLGAVFLLPFACYWAFRVPIAVRTAREMAFEPIFRDPNL